jgi:plastocyanin
MWRLDDLPVHPIAVHLPVVLIPLVAVGAVVYLLMPRWRRRLRVVLPALAIIAAAGAAVAVASGEDLGDALGRGAELADHRALGRRTLVFTLLLAVTTAALARYERRPGRPQHRVVGGAAAVAVIALAATGAAALTGHSGGRLAWEGRVPDDAPSGAAAPAGSTAAAPSPAAAPASGTVSAGGAPMAEPVVDVVLGEWALVASAQEAPPGPTTFWFHNRGTIPHAFRVRTEGSGRDRLEWRSEVVPPGGEGTLTIDLGVGAYEIDCPIEDAHGEHDARGMQSAFAVRDGAPSVTAAVPPPPIDAGADGVPPQDATVAIAGFAFAPATIEIAVGGQVRWENRDPTPHTATASEWNAGELASGSTAAVTFDAPGTYEYFCAFHPGMTGTVVVGS